MLRNMDWGVAEPIRMLLCIALAPFYPFFYNAPGNWPLLALFIVGLSLIAWRSAIRRRQGGSDRSDFRIAVSAMPICAILFYLAILGMWYRGSTLGGSPQIYWGTRTRWPNDLPIQLWDYAISFALGLYAVVVDLAIVGIFFLKRGTRFRRMGILLTVLLVTWFALMLEPSGMFWWWNS